MLQTLLKALRSIEVTLPDGVPDELAVRERLRAGIPALTGEPLMDAAEFRAAVSTFLRQIAERPGGTGQLGRGLSRAIDRRAGVLDWAALTEVALAGRWDAITSFAIGRESDVPPLAVIFDWGTRAALRAGAKRVARVIQEEPWGRGRCPACGELPILAELRSIDSEHARTLRCARCASAWSFVRVGCPSCETRDFRRLSYLHTDGQGETRRIVCCEECRFFVKELATLDPFGADELLEVDLSTSSFDVLATQRGFRRVPVRGA